MEADMQTKMQLIDDGTGGAFFVWGDLCNSNYDIYAQRFLVNGDPVY